MTRPSSLERAFELARSGKYPSIDQIKRRLKSEGLNQDQIDGPVLRRQLRDAIADAALTPPLSNAPLSNAERPASAVAGRERIGSADRDLRTPRFVPER
jgi:hypothetical protein